MKVNNCWVGVGRITNDLVLRNNKEGKKVLSFGIAINEGTKENPHTNFIDCFAYEKFGETIQKYFSKGDQIIVGGRLQTYTVEDRGEKRKKTAVIVDSFEFGQQKKKEFIVDEYEQKGLEFY